MLPQYESDEITSPYAMLPSAQTIGWLVLFLRKCTDPSANRIFAPPGWKLVMLYIAPAFKPSEAPESQFG